MLAAAQSHAQPEALKLKPAAGIASAPQPPTESAQPIADDAGLPLALIRELSKARAEEHASRPLQSLAELLVQTDVNRQGLNETVLVLRSGDGRFFIAGEDLDRWRLRRSDTPALTHRGGAYYPLQSLPGVTYKLNEAQQTLDIQTSAEAFAETVSPLALGRGDAAPVLPQPGGFLNYDLSSAGGGGSRSLHSGLFEAGFFSRFGVITSSVVAPDFQQGAWRRLDTTYTRDNPEQRTSFRVGDSVSRPGAWGRSLRFAGVQYDTNFNTQPGFIRYPVATAPGQATLPSTVDVFVNNALVARREVPPGPFSVTNIPVVSGAGEVRVVVRDILGREQVVVTPFYGTTTLLRKGIQDFSVEAGLERRNFGLESAGYAGKLGVATYRRGLTDDVTAEIRGEYADEARSAGASAAVRIAEFGVLSGTGALSNSNAGGGALAGAGFEHNARPFSFALQTFVTTPGFRQAGMLIGELPRTRQSQASAGLQLGNYGSISTTVTRQRFRDRAAVDVATLSYGLSLGKFGHFGISAVRTLGATGGNTLFATLSVPLDDVTQASVGMDRSRPNAGPAQTAYSATLQRSLPAGDGFGYRVQARDADFFGRLDMQTGYGRYSLDAAKPEAGDTAYRLGAAGGIGRVGGRTFLSRAINESFGIVRVGDFPDVQVLHDNQVVARTGEDGYAVISRLRPYDRNPIRIEQNDLPFDAKVGSLTINASPYFRSGVFVEFPVRRIRAGTLRIVLEDGEDIPSGAVGRLEGSTESFPVALRGELYLEGFEQDNTVVVTWKGHGCTIKVSYPQTTDPLPNLGTFICKGVAR